MVHVWCYHYSVIRLSLCTLYEKQWQCNLCNLLHGHWFCHEHCSRLCTHHDLSFWIHGAAIATLLSQAVTIVGCIYYVKKHQMLKLSKPVNVQKTSLKIMKIGIAPFGIKMSPMVSIFFMNAIHFIMAEL